MKNTKTKKNDPAFLAWQKNTRKLLKKEKVENIRYVNEEFKDVLKAYAAVKSESGRILEQCFAKFECYAGVFTEINAEEFMDTHAAALAEVERLDNDFLKKWGTQYEKYLAAISELEKDYKELVVLTRSLEDYQKALVP